MSSGRTIEERKKNPLAAAIQRNQPSSRADTPVSDRELAVIEAIVHAQRRGNAVQAASMIKQLGPRYIPARRAHAAGARSTASSGPEAA
jgi:hypothetical protein